MILIEIEIEIFTVPKSENNILIVFTVPFVGTTVYSTKCLILYIKKRA